jgi:tetratricopeptide (TPR) repeat protein
VTGKWQGAIVCLLPWLDPINLGILLFSCFVFRRAWQAYSEYHALVPAAEKQLPPVRRTARRFTLVTSTGFAVLLWALSGWGGYLYVSNFAFSGNVIWKERQALDHFNQGAAKIAADPQIAEQAFARSLPMWKDLVNETPSRPDYRQNLGATYQNLAALLTIRGQAAEAERAYRDALAQYDYLEAHFPAYQNHKQNRDRTLQGLAQLTILKPSLEDAAEAKNGRAFEAVGEHQATERTYRQALERSPVSWLRRLRPGVIIWDNRINSF